LLANGEGIMKVTQSDNCSETECIWNMFKTEKILTITKQS